MPSLISFAANFFLIMAMLLASGPASAKDGTVQAAEELMVLQLEALKAKDHSRFIEHGNRAFKVFMDDYAFGSLILQRGAKIAKGYRPGRPSRFRRGVRIG